MLLPQREPQHVPSNLHYPQKQNDHDQQPHIVDVMNGVVAYAALCFLRKGTPPTMLAIGDHLNKSVVNILRKCLSWCLHLKEWCSHSKCLFCKCFGHSCETTLHGYCNRESRNCSTLAFAHAHIIEKTILACVLPNKYNIVKQHGTRKTQRISRHAS